jgi:hypothetical protein
VRIASVNYQIVLVQMGQQIGDNGVNDRPGGDQHHDVSRRFEFGQKVGEIVANIHWHS